MRLITITFSAIYGLQQRAASSQHPTYYNTIELKLFLACIPSLQLHAQQIKLLKNSQPYMRANERKFLTAVKLWSKILISLRLFFDCFKWIWKFNDVDFDDKTHSHICKLTSSQNIYKFFEFQMSFQLASAVRRPSFIRKRSLQIVYDLNVSESIRM